MSISKALRHKTGEKKKGSKYGNRKSRLGFDSGLEQKLYDILLLRERAGEINEIRCQHTVYLSMARIPYIADFSFAENGELVFAEAKGHETPSWRIKKRLWKYYGPGRLEIWYMSKNKWNRGEPFLGEILIPESGE